MIKTKPMKLKFLLSAVLFFYCFNAFAQDGLKSQQGNNGNSNLAVGGCNWYYDVFLNYNVFPPGDSVKLHSFGTDTIFVSGFDSVEFHAYWDPGDCGPISQA